MEIENAVITSVQLGVGPSDHRCMVADVMLTGDGWGQSFGGFALDQWSEKDKRRIGTAYGCEYLLLLMAAVGVDEWGKMKGKTVRIKREGGLNGKIVAIGHIIEDKWFDPAALASRMK